MQLQRVNGQLKHELDQVERELGEAKRGLDEVSQARLDATVTITRYSKHKT